MKNFVWDNKVCRFGLPGEIVSDNGKQFSGDPFKDWCEKLNIVQRFVSVKHLQSNGFVERANRTLGEGIKARPGSEELLSGQETLSLCGYPFKCFLDAYKGYHQIQMAKQDEEKTAFHTSHGTNWSEPRDIRGQLGHQESHGNIAATGYRRNVPYITKDQPEAKSQKMYVRSSKRNVSRIYDQPGRDKTMPRQDEGRVAASIPTNNQRGLGLILTSPEGTEFTYALRFQFTVSNNEAEYEALIAGLRIAAQIWVRNVHVSVDSKLVANQVLGTYVAKEENMIKYFEKAKSLISGFANFSISQVPIKYLRDETLPDNRNEARKLRIKAKQYELLEGILYKCSFLKPWLRCVGPLQANYVIREVHEGSCSMHAGPRSVVAKAMRSGYYWPTMHRDAREMIRKCPGKVMFLIVAMDYFTKWIEVMAVATITDSQMKKFVWDNKVCRFGLPGEIVSDKCKQFSGDPFKDWCEKLNIVQRFVSVKHPQSNGLVERTNRSLGEGIKARLGEGNKNWLEELPHVLWAHRTMIKSKNDDSAFSLTYGTEAVIPAEIRMPTYRTTVVDAVHNDEELRLNLDLLEERRERAAIREAKAKLKMTNHAVDGGKLGPKWEGPYEVTEALRDGAYKLRSTDGTVLSRTWNISNLKKCYH
nr:reverse transcriptase domain-containing protein [Tanacetum cinerariifolium]